MPSKRRASPPSVAGVGEATALAVTPKDWAAVPSPALYCARTSVEERARL